MNDKEFQLQYDLGLARERVAQYVKTIGEQTSEIGRLQALSDEVLDLLAMMFDAYEDGPECYEDPEDCAGHLGKAVNLDEAAFDRIADILNKHRPRNAGEVTANVRVQGRCAALSRSVPWNEVLDLYGRA